MLFNSISFLIFLPLVLVLYYVSPKRIKWGLLLFASYFFYGYWEVGYLLLILITTITSYFSGIYVARIVEERKRLLVLSGALFVNLGILFVFKYFNFFSESINSIADLLGSSYRMPFIEFLLPVGISFYTFQALGYVVDVWRDRTCVERHFGVFALYLSFFPQLVAGPIERSTNLIPQLKVRRTVSWEATQRAFTLILWGFFIKLVIADRVAGYVNKIFETPELYEGPHFLLATILFAYQIFCDFAGYSTIAIGVAQLFGIDLMANFRRPYFSKSIQEFWSRWHISLSTWFKDYLYIPLGGNRVVRWRALTNLLIIFIVSGLWHGAAWTFVIWGILHAICLIVGSLLSGEENQRLGVKLYFPNWLKMIGTFALVCLGWIFFRADSVGDAFYILSHLGDGWSIDSSTFARAIGPFGGGFNSLSEFILVIVFIGVLETVHFLQECSSEFVDQIWRKQYIRLGSHVLLTVFVLLFGVFDNNYFIYFQF